MKKPLWDIGGGVGKGGKGCMRELLLSMHACSKITRVLKQAITKMLQLVEFPVGGVYIPNPFVEGIVRESWGVGATSCGFWLTTKR